MFTGSIVALITPMNESKDIDHISLKKLINYHIDSGTSAIVVAGTTGEVFTLSNKEYIDLVSWTLEFSNGKIPIIVGNGSNSTSKAIELTKLFNKKDGISGYLSIVPYYNRPSQEGIFQHFKSISQYTDLPIILYNVPVRTGCDMFPFTVARLSEIKNIVGIKEATGDLSRVRKIQELVHKNFILLSGDDITALDFMQLGGQGVISVTANIAAKEMVRICALAFEGNFSDARYFNKCLTPLYQELFSESNPIPIKWACKELGLIKTNTMRLPMISLSDENCYSLKKVLTKVKLLL